MKFEGQATIAYYRSGAAHGFPLVLSSSLGTTAKMWSPQLARLGDDHSMITYDHRGHGRSAAPVGPYGLDDLGQDVLDLLDFLSIGSADFVGLSLGGMVGMWLALNAPARIRRLALLCTYAEVTAPEMFRNRAALVRNEGTKSIVDNSIKRWFTHGFRKENPVLVRRFEANLEAVSDEGYASCCEAIATMSINSRLDEIDVPTLVVAGTQDTGATPRLVHALAESIPGSRFEMVDAAHLASVEQAKLVNSLLVDHFC
jgi:3-oxoadipate enol-lactonase